MLSLDKLNKSTQIITSILALFVLTAGLIISWYQYLNYKKDSKKKYSLALENDKKKYSLALVDSYSSGELLKSRVRIESLFLSDLIVNGDIKTASPPKYYSLILSLVKNKKLYGDVLVLAQFFERVARCKTSALCDENIIKDYLHKDGEIFALRFFPYVCYVRDIYSDQQIFARLETYISNTKYKYICNSYYK